MKLLKIWGISYKQYWVYSCLLHGRGNYHLNYLVNFEIVASLNLFNAEVFALLEQILPFCQKVNQLSYYNFSLEIGWMIFGEKRALIDNNMITEMVFSYSLMNMRQLHILFNSAKTWHEIVCWFLCFSLNLPELIIKLFRKSEQNNFMISSGKFGEKTQKSTNNLMSSFGWIE